MAGLTGRVSVAFGEVTSLARMPDGTVRTWGSNRDRQFGNGAIGRRRTPARVW
ncbi:hypothetical protein ACQKGO_26805 [Corallococcus interemptor]|uniref:hypothetical protein n=1 Tax=Corallococcus interemptor TaxID=2316720 RepID=UPI003D042470